MLYAMFVNVEFHNRSTRPPTSRHRPALPTPLPTNSQPVRRPRLPLAPIHRGRSRRRQRPAPPLRSSTSPFQATPPRPDSPPSRERRSAPAPTTRPLTGPARSARSRQRPDLPRAGTWSLPVDTTGSRGHRSQPVQLRRRRWLSTRCTTS